MPALLVSGLIVLSACSSGQSVSTAKNVNVTRPHPSQAPVSVRITGQYTEIFDTPLPANPGQAAVMSGFRESTVLWDQSTVALRLAGTTTEYVTGKALTTLRVVLRSYTSNNLVPVGTDRLYDTKITSLTASGATVTSCDDGTGYDVADRTTGQTEPPASASQAYIFVIYGMRLVGGRWAVSSVSAIAYPDQRVKACMRDSQSRSA
jgi:hypothetical protein